MKKTAKIYGPKGFSVGDRPSRSYCVGSTHKERYAVYGSLGKGSLTMSEKWTYLGAFRTKDK